MPGFRDSERAPRTAALPARAFGVLILAAATASPAGPWPVPPDDEGAYSEELEAKIGALLALTDATPPTATELIGRGLADLGPQAIFALYETLDSGRMPAGVGAPHGADGGGDGSPAAAGGALLGEVQEEALLLALGHLGLRDLRPLLVHDMATPGFTCQRRLVMLRVLGATGRSSELALAVQTTQPGPEQEPCEDLLEVPLMDATHRILLRDPPAHGEVGRLAMASEPAVASALVMAVGAASDPRRGLRVLVSLLRHDHALDQVLLTEVGRIGQRVPEAVDANTRERVRGFLKVDNVQMLREAALAVGKLDDFQACVALIDLLKHSSAPVRGSAHWALTTMTGLDYGQDAARWRYWCDTEAAWFEEHGQQYFLDLESGDVPRIARALGELSRQRYMRTAIARRIAAVLTNRDAAMRKLACVALTQLGTRTVVPELIACLSDYDREVGEAAWVALRGITKLDLPRATSAWEEALLGPEDWRR